MGFEYFKLLEKGASLVGDLIPSGEFTRWGKAVEPSSAAVDIERGLYFTQLYSYWEDDGVRTAVVIGGRGWHVTFMALIEDMPVESAEATYRYTVSVVDNVQRHGAGAPGAEALLAIIVEAIPVYSASGFLIESVAVNGWERL